MINPAFFFPVPLEFAILAIWWASDKLKYTNFHSIKFGGINTRTEVEMAAHCSVIIKLDVMVTTVVAPTEDARPSRFH